MLRKLKEAIIAFRDYLLPKFFSKRRFLATVYYMTVSSAFRRECQGVLIGKVRYYERAKFSFKNYVLVTRNIHRIEKGLLMKPRKAVFAKSFIEETVTNFLGILEANTVETSQIKWFHDVLREYFKVVTTDKFIVELGEKFHNHPLVLIFESGVKKSIPYVDKVQHNVSFESFQKLNRARRSIRWFNDTPVPRELIEKAISVASQAPSACNRQPFYFHIVDDPKKIKEAVDLPMGTKGYGHTIPVLIFVVGNLDYYIEERDRHLIYIDASLANMSFMLTLETLGLSSCPINWPDIEEREQLAARFLGLEPYQRPVMCIAVGYSDPEGEIAFSEKKSLEQLVKYN
jgi:nitroreductase